MTKAEPISLSQAMDYADKWFSKWVRARDGICMTCGNPGGDPPGSGLECGHYISRSVYILRWCERNAVAQCPICNQMHEIDDRALRKVIADMWGADVLEWLRARQFSNEIYDATQILAIGAGYREKYLEMNR